MEMTGLDPETCVIIEVAAVVSDIQLNILQQYATAVFQPADQLAAMDAWCTQTHTESGLLKRIPEGKSLAEVENQLLKLIETHFDTDQRVILCGNSIGQDRKFIDRYMPQLARRLHYRMIDVSSFKEVFRDRYGVEFKKDNKHEALADILESIKELTYYLQFVRPEGSI